MNGLLRDRQLPSTAMRPAWTVSVASWLSTSMAVAVGAFMLPCVLPQVVGAFGAMGPAAVASVVACAVVWPLAAFALLWPSSLTLGADGVALRWLWRRQWVAWQDVIDVQLRAYEVRVVTRDGRTLAIPTRRAFGIDERSVRLGRELFARIEAARRGLGSPSSLQSLERPAGLSVDEWIQSLRAVGQGAAGHLRQMGVSPELLRETLESRAVPELTRAAAAVALAATGAREDVRVRVEAMASPRLRAVMTAAAEEDHDGLVAAMREVEAFVLPRRGEKT